MCLVNINGKVVAINSMKFKRKLLSILIFVAASGAIAVLWKLLDTDIDWFVAIYNSITAVMVIYVGTLMLFIYPIAFLRKYWEKKKSQIDLNAKPKYKVYDRLMRNTNALAGGLFILWVALAAIFAHIIIPDKSPYAGDQMNEIAYKEPGFSVKVLLVPADRHVSSTGVIDWFLNGKTSSFKQIPFNDAWLVKGDSLYVSRYLGDNMVGIPMVFATEFITGKKSVVAEQSQIIENEFIETRHFWLGTDDLGRDYLSRIILGARVSLSVGIIAVLIALFIGIPLGALAGFYKQYPPKLRFGKKRAVKVPVDNSVMWMINIVWSIPTLLLVFPIVFAFGQQYYTIFIAVGITMWVDIARMVRGQVMQVREMEFVQAARTFGFSDTRTIWRHVLPNITGPVIVVTAANFAYAILTEAGLSFLGIGVQPPAPSWGLMIAKYKDNLITDPYLPLIPGFAITLLVLAFFMVGNGLRDALDIKSRL